MFEKVRNFKNVSMMR